MEQVEQLTLENAIKIQKEQLKVWSLKLGAECYCALEDYIIEKNMETLDPSSVIMKDAMLDFIINYKPKRDSNFEIEDEPKSKFKQIPLF